MSYALSLKLRDLREFRPEDPNEPRIIAFWCPACDSAHAVHVGKGTGPRWEWNESVNEPTFRPSLLVRTGYTAVTRPQRVCHLFVVDGHIQYLSDCTHGLAGQTVPIPDWPLDVPEWALERNG